VGGGSIKRRPLAWGNVLLMGGGVGVLVTAFLFVLSLIRSYVEPPRIPVPRPMLASAESMPVELPGLAELDLPPINLARTTAMENLATAMVQGAGPSPSSVDHPAPADGAVPLPPRRPRAGTLTQLSSAVPVPRPRPRD
jgi:hypothetical protein